MAKYFWYATWALAAIAFGLLAWGLFSARQTKQFKKHGITARGTVMELVERISHSEEGTSVTYAPRVVFRTDGGQEFEFLSTTGSNPPSFHPGQVVDVLYERGRPETATIDAFWDLWLGPVVEFIIGGAFAVFAIIFFLLASYLSREENKTGPGPTAVHQGKRFGARQTFASHRG